MILNRNKNLKNKNLKSQNEENENLENDMEDWKLIDMITSKKILLFWKFYFYLIYVILSYFNLFRSLLQFKRILPKIFWNGK